MPRRAARHPPPYIKYRRKKHGCIEQAVPGYAGIPEKQRGQKHCPWLPARFRHVLRHDPGPAADGSGRRRRTVCRGRRHTDLPLVHRRADADISRQLIRLYCGDPGRCRQQRLRRDEGGADRSGNGRRNRGRRDLSCPGADRAAVRQAVYRQTVPARCAGRRHRADRAGPRQLRDRQYPAGGRGRRSRFRPVVHMELGNRGNRLPARHYFVQLRQRHGQNVLHCHCPRRRLSVHTTCRRAWLGT